MVSSQLWQVTSTAAYRRVSPQASVTAIRPSPARVIRATPGLGAPECSEASEVPAGQWASRGAGWRQILRGTCSAPPTTSRWFSSQPVITTRKISSMEFG